MRTCVGCRERRPAEELVRLAVDADGRVLPDLDGRAPGRGAWVCPQRTCVSRAHPSLPRAFRRSVTVDPDLALRIAEQYRRSSQRLLQRCNRDGLVLSGSRRVHAAIGTPLVAVIYSCDISPGTLARMAKAFPDIPRVHLGLGRAGLGGLLGRGPRVLVAVRPSGRARRLAEQLRRIDALG